MKKGSAHSFQSSKIHAIQGRHDPSLILKLLSKRPKFKSYLFAASGRKWIDFYALTRQKKFLNFCLVNNLTRQFLNFQFYHSITWKKKRFCWFWCLVMLPAIKKKVKLPTYRRSNSKHEWKLGSKFSALKISTLSHCLGKFY